MNNRLAEYMINKEPYYQAIGNEVELFEGAMKQGLPMVLKGPTGCGKTRFVEYMAWRMKRPLITLACNEDMTAADLVGRYLLDVEGTKWHDGPLTLAVRHGGICYLDEVVEVRQDTTVVLHPLTDERRILPLDKHGEIVKAHPDFRLVVSYNPGYQSAAKDFKPSTKQRFGAINFDFPEPETETQIVMKEGGIEVDVAERLVGIAGKSRALEGHGLEEGISTRMLVHAGRLMADGISPRDACMLALSAPITDDPELLVALEKFVEVHFGFEQAPC